MKYLLRSRTTALVFLISLTLLGSCGEDEEEPNQAPIVANTLNNQTFLAGFGTEDIELSATFSDPEHDELTLSVFSDDATVVTASIVGTILTITEAGTGSTDVTVSATDNNGSTAKDSFAITVTEVEDVNRPPSIVNFLADLTLTSGFDTEDIELSATFTDLDDDLLILSVMSDDESVVIADIVGTVLTITEVGEGATTITVTADDGNDTVVDSFSVSVTEDSNAACELDNSVSFTLNDCTNDAASAGLTAEYSETVSNDIRTIITNGVPNHSFGSPIALIEAISVTWTMDATPETGESITSVLGMERIDFQFGVGLNGVKLDPAAAFPFENTNTGELNYEWVLEATNNNETTTLDCNQAHLQAQGVYHYHGDFEGYAEVLSIDGTSMVQVGWAADGFPIYYKYAYADALDDASEVVEMKSSYQIKEGDRPGDGFSEPCGAYNGKYEQDYEFGEAVGDLDECNGRTGVTPEFPEGTYYYLITETYPLIPRCFMGTPNNSFRVGTGG